MGGGNNPKYTFFQLGDGASRQGQPAGFHLAAIILCLVYTIKLQCLAFILTVIVCLIADSSMSHPDRVSDFGKASSLTLVVAIWAVNASSIFSLAPASLGFATTAFLGFLQISGESMVWRLSRGRMSMYTQPGPSYDLIVLWMTSHISADTSVCGRWQGGSGSRATAREKSRIQKQPKPGKPERYHWWVRWGRGVRPTWSVLILGITSSAQFWDSLERCDWILEGKTEGEGCEIEIWNKGIPLNHPKKEKTNTRTEA